MAENFKSTAHAHNMCATCARHFATPEEKQAFLAKQVKRGGAYAAAAWLEG